MSNLYNKIAKLCTDRGITGYKLCKDLNIRPSIITDLKAGRKKSLSTENITKISNYFEVSVETLLGDKTAHNKKDILYSKDVLSKEDVELLTLFRSVPKNIQDAAIAVLKSYTPTTNTSEERYTIKIAARNGGPIKETTITDSDLKKINDLPDLDI